MPCKPDIRCLVISDTLACITVIILGRKFRHRCNVNYSSDLEQLSFFYVYTLVYILFINAKYCEVHYCLGANFQLIASNLVQIMP